VFLAIYEFNKRSLLRANSRKEDVLLVSAELVFSISKAFKQLAIGLICLIYTAHDLLFIYPKLAPTPLEKVVDKSFFEKIF
jgi:hypothetical protein